MIVGGGYEMRTDDAVSCPAADEESSGQEPEGARLGGKCQSGQGSAGGTYRAVGRVLRAFFGGYVFGRTVGTQTDVLGAISNYHPHEWDQCDTHDCDTKTGITPTETADDIGEEGEENQ